MRILHVISEMTVGGAERMVLELAAEARTRGDEVAVASSGGKWVERLRELHVDSHCIPRLDRSPVSMIAAARRLHPLVESFRPHLVHTHNVGVTVATRLAVLALRTRPAMITTLHGLAHVDYPKAAKLLRWSSRRVVACAPAVAESLVGAGFPPGRIDVITNGATLQPAGRERQEAARTLLNLPTRPLVVGVGRLVEQKSWETLIAASAHLPGIPIVVAGEGPLRAALEDASRRAGGAVRFLGNVDDVAALLGLASCFVSTSAWEGLPLSLLEALSLGVPAVTTAVGGVAQVVPGDAVILVPPGEPRAVARAVGRVLADSVLADRMSSVARQISETWSSASMLAKYRDAYGRALVA